MKQLTATLPFLLLAYSTDASHCPHGQLWRVRLNQCVALSSPLAKPYLNRIVPVRVAQREVVAQPKALEPNDPSIDFPLPDLKDMKFEPDCNDDWCQRLKGIGMLRELMQSD